MSFVLSGIGLIWLPMSTQYIAFCVAGMLAQFGQGLFNGPIRLLLVRSVTIDEQREAIGWFRTGNNLALIFASIFSYLFSGIGIGYFFIADGVTSFLATVFGWWSFPDLKSVPAEPSTSIAEAQTSTANLSRLIALAVAMGGYMFLYEIFIVSSAATARIYFGEAGVRIFSVMTLVNTVACTACAIAAAKFFRNPAKVMPAGILLTMIGGMIYATDKTSLTLLWISTLFITFGEIVYAAVAQFAMLRLIPSGKRDGTLYSISMVIQYLARAFGGACAFPILVRGHYEMATLGTAGVVSLGVLWAIRSDLNRTTGPVQAKS